MEKRFIGVKDLAVYFGMSENAIRDWIKQGRIPFVKFGRSVRFDLHKLETWIKNNEYAYIKKEYS